MSEEHQKILMVNLLPQFRSYLANDCGFTRETVKTYMSKMTLMTHRLNLTTLKDLTDGNLSNRWMELFWESMFSERPISDASRRLIVFTLKQFVKFLVKDELIEEKYIHRIKIPKPTDVFYTGMSSKEQETLKEFIFLNLKSEINKRDAALIFFLWATGCRISEALALNVHADSKIVVDNPLARSGSFFISADRRKKFSIYVHINGKGKRQRQIPVNDEALAMMNLYLESRKYKNEILFQGRRGKRLQRAGAYRAIRIVLANAGIQNQKNVATHLFRHTFIDECISNSIPANEIITMAGMSSTESLEPYYSRSLNLTRKLGDEFNPLKRVDISDRLRQFSELLRKRYAFS